MGEHRGWSVVAANFGDQCNPGSPLQNARVVRRLRGRPWIVAAICDHVVSDYGLADSVSEDIAVYDDSGELRAIQLIAHHLRVRDLGEGPIRSDDYLTY